MNEQFKQVSGVLPPILERWRHDPTALVQILREVQEALDWISPEAIDAIEQALQLPRSKIEGVAGFYSFFYSRPRGRYRVLFSDNIIERMQGSVALMDRMCKSLWVEKGKVSEDGLVSVDATSCIGMGDQGPALLVNNMTVARLTEARVDQLCELIRSEVPLGDWPAELFVVEDNIRRRDVLLDSAMVPGEALQAARARAGHDGLEASNTRSWREGLPAGLVGPAALIDEVRRAGLRGRGGAGFSTGAEVGSLPQCAAEGRARSARRLQRRRGRARHLQGPRAARQPCRPGAFEGMTVCAYAIGATRGFLYLRGEYRYLLDP
jgi:[NiFe] hydrogenase diaphorase moiety large subunit